MSWPLPLIFTSWGFRHKGDRWQTGQELADWCNSCGFRTVAVQLGLDEHGHTKTERSDVEPLRAAGLKVVVWGVADPSYVAAELLRLGATVDEWFPQVENPPERDLVIAAANSGLHSSAIVSNYGGASTPEDIRRLREAGVRQVFVECYAGEGGAYGNLDTMVWQGTMYGWSEDELYTCLGSYRQEMPSSYQHLEYTAKGFAVYLAEPMNGDQWVAFGQLGSRGPPPEPEPPTPEDDMEQVSDQQGRDAVGFAVQAAAQNWGDDEKPRARLTVCRRIAQASNDDAKWNKIRDQIVTLLDSVGVPK